MSRWSVAFLAVSSVFAFGCESPPVGDASRPFTMYFVPSVDAESIATSADEIVEYLEGALSEKLFGDGRTFHIQAAIPTSYVAVVEAFGSGRADFAALNTFSYILAKDVKKYDVEALLTVVRGEDETTYKGQIIAHADSDIESLDDLQGKKFAYVDPASTAGFIMPSSLFRSRGIELGEVVYGGKHDIVVTMVYQKQVDAGATYYSPPRISEKGDQRAEIIRDARAKVKTQFPDVEDKVKIVGFTESIPNDPWIIRSDIFDTDPAMQEKLETALVEALMEYAATADGKAALHELYNISGLVRATDATYGPIRVMLAETDIEELIGR